MLDKFRKVIHFIKTNKDMKVVVQFAHGNVAVYILIYLQAVIINKSLSPFDLGKYSYYQSLLILILSVVSLTIYTAHLRFLGFVDTKKLFKLIRKVLIIAALLYIGIVLVLWNTWEFVPFAAFMWFNEQLYYFRSLTRIRLYTTMKCIQYVILIVLLGVLILSQHATYKMLLLSMGMAYFLTYVLFYNERKKCTIEQRGQEEYNVKEIFGYCAPGAASVVSLYLLASVDQIFIDKYLLPSDLSSYAMALRILTVIQLLTAVFMDYWPRFYFERATERDYGNIIKMRFLFKGAIIIFSGICILLVIPIYYVMGARAYIGQSTWIFSILAFGEIFRVAGSINMTYRSFTKESIYNVAILGGLGLIKLLINYLSIERYGLIILVSTTVGSYIAYWIISNFISLRTEKDYMYSK